MTEETTLLSVQGRSFSEKMIFDVRPALGWN